MFKYSRLVSSDNGLISVILLNSRRNVISLVKLASGVISTISRAPRKERLVKLVPEEFLLDAHHWLILHGRYICVARKPRCSACVIEDLCEFKKKSGS